VDSLVDIHQKDSKIIEEMERALHSWTVYSTAGHNESSAPGNSKSRLDDKDYERHGPLLAADDEDTVGLKAAEMALASKFSVNDCLEMKRKIRSERSSRKKEGVVPAKLPPVEPADTVFITSNQSHSQQVPDSSISPRPSTSLSSPAKAVSQETTPPKTVSAKEISPRPSPTKAKSPPATTSPVTPKRRPVSAPVTSTSKESPLLPDIFSKNSAPREEQARQLFAPKQQPTVESVKKFNEMKRLRRSHSARLDSNKSSPAATDDRDNSDRYAGERTPTKSSLKAQQLTPEEVTPVRTVDVTPMSANKSVPASPLFRNNNVYHVPSEQVSPRAVAAESRANVRMSQSVMDEKSLENEPEASAELQRLRAMEDDLLRRQRQIFDRQEKYASSTAVLGNKDQLQVSSMCLS
jgi:hypothetical protein